MIRTSLFAVALLAAPLARAEDPAPLAGDAVGGARLYRLHCAACHGTNASGAGPLASAFEFPPGPARDGGFLYGQFDDAILKKFLGEDSKGPMQLHGRGLTALEARDLLTWLRADLPLPGDAFPNANEFIAHKHKIDEEGLNRAEKAVGEPLAGLEKTPVIFTVFKPEAGEPAAKGAPQRIPEEVQALDKAKPRRKIGFAAYLTLKLNDGPLDVLLSTDKDLHVKAVRAVGGDEKQEALRKKLQPMLDTFVGAGGRVEKKPIEPQGKGQKAPPDVVKAMARAFTVLTEGAAMYLKEEKDRFIFEPEAYKSTADDQPEDTKFEFKQKK